MSEVDNTKVICPACCHQFRAIPVQVQRLMLDAGFEPPFLEPAHPPAALPDGWLAEAERLMERFGEMSVRYGKTPAEDSATRYRTSSAALLARDALLAHLKLAEGQVEHGDALRDAFPDLSAAAKGLGGIGSKGVGDV